LSSPDGQRFPTKGRSITGRAMSRYFARGQGISTYTHVSDQHSTFDTKVIVATAPEGHYVLDGLLGNGLDLPITEHATDTHGASLANFALFDLVGMQLSPRIRDLGKITLYWTGALAGVGPLAAQGVQVLALTCRVIQSVVPGARSVPGARRPAELALRPLQRPGPAGRPRCGGGVVSAVAPPWCSARQQCDPTRSTSAAGPSRWAGVGHVAGAAR